MSVPLDRLYHFLHDHCNHDVIIYHFYPHGSKNLGDIVLLKEYTQDANFYTLPHILFHDQEPLDFNVWPEYHQLFYIPNVPYSKIKTKVGRFGIHNKPILVHSELNSLEVAKFEKDGAIPVYYWSHAIIALDWFRYAEFDQRLQHRKVSKKFLVYNRAWQGSREYRLKFVELLIESGLESQCKISFSPFDHEVHYRSHIYTNNQFKIGRFDFDQILPANLTDSSASADYNHEDYITTEVEVILETLFDDQRLHLTEKTLRAIAVGQPFLLCAPPGSLNYLRGYGFETFSQCWDESYDNIIDPLERLQAVIKAMQQIASNADIALAQKIAQRNRQRFFSREFFNQVVNEYKTNIQLAIQHSYQWQNPAYFLRHCASMKAMKDTVPLEVFDYIDNLRHTGVNKPKEIGNELVQAQTCETSSAKSAY